MADEKKIIQDSATEATAMQRQASQKANAEALEELKEEMEVNELPPEELAKWREKAKPVIEKYTQAVGPELVAELMAEVQKVRQR